MFLSHLVVALASEVVFLKMPSRNQKKRSKQRAEYLQKQDENKAKARALYKADQWRGGQGGPGDPGSPCGAKMMGRRNTRGRQ